MRAVERASPVCAWWRLSPAFSVASPLLCKDRKILLATLEGCNFFGMFIGVVDNIRT